MLSVDEVSRELQILKILNMRTQVIKKLLALLISLLAFGFSWGQSLDWAKGFGWVNYDAGKSIAVDSLGNVYTIGFFQGTVDFNHGAGIFNLTANGEYDIFITKLDNKGNFIWAKRIGGINSQIGCSITIDTYGNIYTTGYFTGTVDFDPDFGTYNLSSFGSWDVFILKMNSDGHFIWAKQIGGASSDAGYYIAIDDSNNVYTTGRFSGDSDFDPSEDSCILSANTNWQVFISKLDSDGNFVWAKQMGSNGIDYGASIDFDALCNVYITGNFDGISDFDPGIDMLNLIPVGLKDVFILKLNNNGQFQWVKQIGGTGFDVGRDIKVDSECNIYLTGYFENFVKFGLGSDSICLNSIGDKDIFIAKLDSLGNFIWAKQMGGTSGDQGFSLAIDMLDNVYITGSFSGIADFDPDTLQTFNLTTNSNSDVFISKLDSSGNFIWAKKIGGIESDFGHSIQIDFFENVYLTGEYQDTLKFNLNSLNNYKIISEGSYDVFILKIRQQGITGYIFNDINQNCQRDSLDIGIQNRIVKINPGNIITQTNEAGIWVIDSLPIGTYTATLDTSGNWSPTCSVTQTFTVTNPNEITYVPDFGLVSTQTCASPDISVNMPFMRPCFENQKIYINATNKYIATGALNSAYADIELDENLIFQSASLAYTSLGNNIYRFQLGNLNPGQSKYFTIDCKVNCNAILGQTLCMKANLYPADSCVFDTIPNPYPGDYTPCTLPWDKSSLNVEGYCQNDSIYFVITNTGELGNGDMDCFSPVRIYIDGTLSTLDSIKLVGGDSIVFVFAGDGRTWRLEADQHPLHPGNSHPNATIEACGNMNNWTPDLVNVLPPDDSDPIVDIYCGLVTGSYDPNDKTGFPTGLAYNRYIMPNQQLQYVIRFQNTGTDTAFTVIIRDTLDTDLDIFSVVPGTASHNYNFQMYGPRVLEWYFYNIQLADSNHSEANSHGFCTFTVNQNRDLPNGTIINNSADIYFDFNAPITTNQTLHTINDMVQTGVVTQITQRRNKLSEVLIYPNPATDEIFIEMSSFEKGNMGYKVFSIEGKLVMQGKLEGSKTRISTRELESGVYFIEVESEKFKVQSKLVVTK